MSNLNVQKDIINIEIFTQNFGLSQLFLILIPSLQIDYLGFDNHLKISKT